MNNFFIDKVKKLRQGIPNTIGNPIDRIKSLLKNRSCTFKLRPVHPDDIKDILENLKNKKSCGLDNIDAYCIKLVKNELVPAITHIVNIPKTYRPVALLPIFSKILERAVFQQLVLYLEENSLLHPSHHGFRTKHNTTTA